MQWFKHHNNFRRSPAMQQVAILMGDRGVAAVYRLYEVFTERFGVDNNFTGSLHLYNTTLETWLANEILIPPPDEDWGPFLSVAAARERLTDLKRFLGVCSDAGLIELSIDESEVWESDDDDGTHKVKSNERHKWMTITIPGFAALADEYTARKRTGKALQTPQ
jgi:hypothetical protein